jgi:hypothetical protein
MKKKIMNKNNWKNIISTIFFITIHIVLLEEFDQ